eukprot:11429977-Prorocentrum_lima.AAC.1
MTSSLVGSEMCIRDSPRSKRMYYILHHINGMKKMNLANGTTKTLKAMNCLLYTSDAADDM